MIAGIVIMLVGLALLAVVGWAWRGRSDASRFWAASSASRTLFLSVVPGMGVMLFGAGLLTLVQSGFPNYFDTLSLLLALPMLATVILFLVGMLNLLPKWWGPKWFRDMVRKERKPPSSGFW